MSEQEKCKPMVSVLMPVYNAAPYLRQSVGSVLGQSFTDYELLCFNDASTDNSLAILKELQKTDDRIRIIDSPVNIKQGGGRNRLLDAAEGEFIIFLDADDMLAEGMMKNCVHAAEKKRADAVFYDFARFSADSDMSKLKATNILGPDASKLATEELRKRLIQHPMPVWSAMYRKTLITENGLYFPEGVFYEDNAVALAIQLSARHPIKIDEIGYLYRCDNFSVSRSKNNYHFFDRINSAILLLEHLKRLGLYDEHSEDIDWVFVNQYYIHTIYGAIYRFDKVCTDKIADVRKGISQYVPAFKSNRNYRALPLLQKIKLETHTRFPRLIKILSNIKNKKR